MTADVFGWIAEHAMRRQPEQIVRQPYTNPSRLVEAIELMNRPVTPAELRRALGIGKSTLQRQTRNAIDAGKIEALGKGSSIRYQRKR